ncbi:MAG: imidazolonepropionase [Phycisphaerales bacterium JB040]
MTPPRPLLITNARVLTLDPDEDTAPPLRGPHPTTDDLAPLERADVLVTPPTIAEVGRGLVAPDRAEVLDAGGRVLMPGFVDCHTHACFAGSRLGEWEQKLAGAGYLDLLRRGGGIMSTVRAVREASRDELAGLLLARLDRALTEGTTTIEVKSGYGLSTEHELKMLRAIADAAEEWPGTVVPTACCAHCLDPEVDAGEFVERTITETLPAVASEFPGITVDGYCEQGAWSLDQSLRYIRAATDLGLHARFHADQFHDLGFIPEAIGLGVRSVDHLEASAPEHLELLADSETFAVILPASGFHLDGRYANGRAFLDAPGRGRALCVATNYNPGSAPCLSVPAAIALSVRGCGLTPAEAIAGATRNPARLLGFTDRAHVAPGARADLVLLHHADERALAFEFGGAHAHTVIAGGIIQRAAPADR